MDIYGSWAEFVVHEAGESGTPFSAFVSWVNLKAHLISALLLLSIVLIGCDPTPLEPIEITGSYTIGYSIPDSGQVTISVENRFDTVVQIYDLGTKGPGSYHLTWDRLDSDGNPLLPGLYFLTVQLVDTDFSITKDILLLEQGI